MNTFYSFIKHLVRGCFFALIVSNCADPKLKIMCLPYTHTDVAEPSISISRKDVNKLIISCNTDSSNLFISDNAGKNWTAFRSHTSFGIGADPFIFSNKKGQFYYLRMNGSSDGILVRRSENGKDFSDGVLIGKRGMRVQERPSGWYDDDSGILHVFWTEFDAYGSSKPSDSTRIWYAQSRSNGDSFERIQVISKIQGDCLDQGSSLIGVTSCKIKDSTLCAVWPSKQGLMFCLSKNNGITWENEKKVGEIKNDYDFQLRNILWPEGLPNVTSDNNNNVFINFCEKRNDSTAYVCMIKSYDGGQNWSETINIFKDTRNQDMFTAWMKYDETAKKLYVINYGKEQNENNISVWLSALGKEDNEFKHYELDKFYNAQTPLFVGDYIMLDVYQHRVAAAWTSLINNKKTIKYVYFKK